MTCSNSSGLPQPGNAILSHHKNYSGTAQRKQRATLEQSKSPPHMSQWTEDRHTVPIPQWVRTPGVILGTWHKLKRLTLFPSVFPACGLLHGCLLYLNWSWASSGARFTVRMSSAIASIHRFFTHPCGRRAPALRWRAFLDTKFSLRMT